MKSISHLLFDYLVEAGISENLATYVNMLVLLAVLLIGLYIIDYLLRKFILAAFTCLLYTSDAADE